MRSILLILLSLSLTYATCPPMTNFLNLIGTYQEDLISQIRNFVGIEEFPEFQSIVNSDDDFVQLSKDITNLNLHQAWIQTVYKQPDVHASVASYNAALLSVIHQANITNWDLVEIVCPTSTAYVNCHCLEDHANIGSDNPDYPVVFTRSNVTDDGTYFNECTLATCTCSDDNNNNKHGKMFMAIDILIGFYKCVAETAAAR